VKETGRHIAISFGGSEKRCEIIEDPSPHILVDSEKRVHGWKFYDYQDGGHRECSQERLLVNAYSGCWQGGARGCAFCYTRALWGYFRAFWERGVATVFRDFDKKVLGQISRLQACPALYLSPVTDPFMDLEEKYGLNKRIIEGALEVNLPCEFITKMGGNLLRWRGYRDLVRRMGEHPHCFAQFTIYAREEVRRRLSPGSSPVAEQLEAMELCRDEGLYTVCRLDPFIPHLTDTEEDFRAIAADAADAGASHLVASCIDVPRGMGEDLLPLFARLSGELGEGRPEADYRRLFRENIRGDLNAAEGYRREKFSLLADVCRDEGLTFSVCMEFKVGEGGEVSGFNEEFMTSPSCEGAVVPIYVRGDLGSPFHPLRGCNGNCLSHAKGEGECGGVCGHAPFRLARGNGYAAYRAYEPPGGSRTMDDFLGAGGRGRR
jgi:DNA repair photolyase